MSQPYNYYPTNSTTGASQGTYEATLKYYRDYYTSLGYDPASAQSFALQYANAQFGKPSTYYPAPSTPSAPVSSTSHAQPTAPKPSYASIASLSSQTASKPAYIPVNIKTKSLPGESVTGSAPTTQMNKPTASTSAPKATGPASWPDDLKKYVAKVFDSCDGKDRDAVEKQLKALILDMNRKNALHSTDWSKMPLPSLCKKDTPEPQAAAATPSLKPFQPSQPQIAKPPPPVPAASSSHQVPQKRKVVPESPPVRRRNVLEPSPEPPDSPASSSSLAGLPMDEMDRRQKRARRFEVAEKARQHEGRKQAIINEQARTAFLAAGADGNPDVIDWDESTIIGTCQKLEKSYLRLTSAPDPSTVRPLAVLRKTLEMLRQKWKEESNYTYICDQFKSLRQDLTVQRIKNPFTVQVYEMHARIALEKGDLGEYNQCQAQLKSLYALGLTGNEEEFIAYRILYFIHTLNRTALGETMAQLSPEHKKHKNIHHALAVRSAISRGDYHALFRLYETAPSMSSYLMDQFLERERLKAMKVICRAYRPNLSLFFVSRELGFKSAKLFRKWLNDMGRRVDGQVVQILKKQNEIDTKTWQSVFEKQATVTKIDIKGQIH